MTFAFRPADMQPHATPGGHGPRLVAPGSVTQGEFGLFETTVEPGGGTPFLHYHTGYSESFYVLEGRLQLHLGDDVAETGPGGFAYVSRHGLHGFTNIHDEPARALILFTPGAPREDYFREMAELYQQVSEPTREQLDEVAARHDQVNVGRLRVV